MSGYVGVALFAVLQQRDEGQATSLFPSLYVSMVGSLESFKAENKDNQRSDRNDNLCQKYHL